MVRLVLTIPVSTTTTEWAFSAMKIVKTNLQNKMENDFLTDSLMLYIEKDIASTFSLDSIGDYFEDLKGHWVSFSQMIVLRNNSVSCLFFFFVGRWLYLNILRNNDFWVFVLVGSLLILYGCVFEIFSFAYLRRSPSPPPHPTWNLRSVPELNLLTYTNISCNSQSDLFL